MNATVDDPTPFADLVPDTILTAIEALGIRTDGRLLALNSYENRVYQVGVEDQQPVVAKFYRPGRWSDEQIAEEHAFVAELSEHEIPVVAPFHFNGSALHHHGRYRVTVYPRQGGRPPELENLDTLEWMGRFLGRIHAVGAAGVFHHRPTISIDSFGVESRDWLLAHDFVPQDIRPAWESVVNLALDGVRTCFDRAGDVAAIRLHGDCHAGNVLWTDSGPHFVDFDDCRTGPAVQDLWMLLSGDRAAMSMQLDTLIESYEQFHDFNRRELHLLEALRTLRLIHYSAWLARRWDDPAFPMAFPWFNTQRYWQDRVLELREQIAAMQEQPIGLAA